MVLNSFDLIKFGKTFFDPLFPARTNYDDEFEYNFRGLHATDFTIALASKNDGTKKDNYYFYYKVIKNRFLNYPYYVVFASYIYVSVVPQLFFSQYLTIIFFIWLVCFYVYVMFEKYGKEHGKLGFIFGLRSFMAVLFNFIFINVFFYLYTKNTFGVLLVLPLIAIGLLLIVKYMSKIPNYLTNNPTYHYYSYATNEYKLDRLTSRGVRADDVFDKGYKDYEQINVKNNYISLPFQPLHARFQHYFKRILVAFMVLYFLLFILLVIKFNAFAYPYTLLEAKLQTMLDKDYSFLATDIYDYRFKRKSRFGFNSLLKFLYYNNGFQIWNYTEFCFWKFNFINMFGKLVISPIFAIETISLLFMGLTMILVLLCIIFLWPTFEYDKNILLYVSQLLLLLTQLNITFTTLDILTFFIAFESLLIPMIIMIAFWGSKNNRQANNYLIFYTMVSALPMLFAILFLIHKTGTTNLFLLFSRMHYLSFMEQSMVWLSFFFAFAVKTPMVPFHIWLPKTHVDAPTVGSVILAGVLLKIGLIGMIRFLFPLLPEVTHFFAPYVAAVATVGVIYASFITLRQIDMKRIIAYSSVAHMNMAMVSLCSLNAVGFYSTVYLMLSHGLIASGLFFLVGFLYNRFHVRSVYYYSGLAMCMPILTVFFFLFTLANMAFPLTSGFIGEFLLLLGITINNFYLGFLNAVNMLLTTVYSVLLFGRVFLGELKVWLEKIVFNYIWVKYNYPLNNLRLDLYPYETFISMVLFSGIFVLGVYPEIVFKAINFRIPFIQLLYTYPSFL